MAGDDTLNILRADLAELLAAEDVPHGAACAITDKFIERLRQRYGGDRLLVPKIDRAKRDAAILADWRNGLTFESIAERQGVCRQTIYRVLQRRRQKAMADDADFGSAEWHL